MFSPSSVVLVIEKTAWKSGRWRAGNGLLQISMYELLFFPTIFLFWSVEAFPNENHRFITPRMCTMVLTFAVYCVPSGDLTGLGSLMILWDPCPEEVLVLILPKSLACIFDDQYICFEFLNMWKGMESRMWVITLVEDKCRQRILYLLLVRSIMAKMNPSFLCLYSPEAALRLHHQGVKNMGVFCLFDLGFTLALRTGPFWIT